MKNFIGIGQGNAESALDQAIKGLINPNMILFMTSYEKAEKTAKLGFESDFDTATLLTEIQKEKQAYFTADYSDLDNPSFCFLCNNGRTFTFINVKQSSCIFKSNTVLI